MKKLMFQKKLMLIYQINQKINQMSVINVITAYEIENIAILNVKGVDYRCVLWNTTKNDVINYKLDDKDTL